jgi:hypothetical protein
MRQSHNINTFFLLLTFPWERGFITETRRRVEVYIEHIIQFCIYAGVHVYK